jgi:hypothetical protein
MRGGWSCPGGGGEEAEVHDGALRRHLELGPAGEQGGGEGRKVKREPAEHAGRVWHSGNANIRVRAIR